MTRVGQVVWPFAVLALYVAAFRGATGAGAATGGPALLERAVPGMSGVGRVLSDPAALGCEAPALADVTVLELCLTLQPNDVELMLDLGARYESARRSVDAERVYLRALRVDPRDGDVHLRLGRLLLERGDLAGARREAGAALSVQPGNPESATLIARATGRAGP